MTNWRTKIPLDSQYEVNLRLFVLLLLLLLLTGQKTALSYGYIAPVNDADLSFLKKLVMLIIFSSIE